MVKANNNMFTQYIVITNKQLGTGQDVYKLAVMRIESHPP